MLSALFKSFKSNKKILSNIYSLEITAFLLFFRTSNCLFPICVPIHVDPGNGGVRNQSQSWDGLDLYQCGLSLSMRGLFKSLYTVGDQRDGLFSLRDAPNLWARLASACARSLIQSDLKKAKRVALGGGRTVGQKM